jgi:hypothetical protein
MVSASDAGTICNILSPMDSSPDNLDILHILRHLHLAVQEFCKRSSAQTGRSVSRTLAATSRRSI